jgi:hypothetical protein
VLAPVLRAVPDVEGFGKVILELVHDGVKRALTDRRVPETEAQRPLTAGAVLPKLLETAFC